MKTPWLDRILRVSVSSCQSGISGVRDLVHAMRLTGRKGQRARRLTAAPLVRAHKDVKEVRLVTRSRGYVLVSMLLVAAVALAGGGTGGATAAPASARQTPPETRTVAVEGGGRYADVSAAGLAAMLERKDFLLINVHIPYEGEIPGTDLFFPFDQVEANLNKLPAHKGAKLVLYCRSGRMSAIAARTLVKLGYTGVWNLEGGMIAWKQSGFPVAQRAR